MLKSFWLIYLWTDLNKNGSNMKMQIFRDLGRLHKIHKIIRYTYVYYTTYHLDIHPSYGQFFFCVLNKIHWNRIYFETYIFFFIEIFTLLRIKTICIYISGSRSKKTTRLYICRCLYRRGLLTLISFAFCLTYYKV